MEKPHTQAQQQLYATGRQAVIARDWSRVSVVSQQWLSQWPNHPEGHYLAGLMAGNAERFSLAAKAFERALRLDDSRADAALHLARCLVRTGEHRQAVQLVNIALPDVQQSGYLLDLAGSVLTHVGCHQRALALYRQAVALCPGRADFLSNLSACALFNGEMDVARTSLEQGLALNPNDARAWWQLSRLKQTNPHDIISQISRLQPHWQNPLDLAYGHYALGKLYEDEGNWGEAATAYQAAALHARKVVPGYNKALETALVDAIIEKHTGQWLAAASASNASNDGSTSAAFEPLFIVGLPRTGTTLVDTILTSHTKVSGAGELQFFGLGVKKLSGIAGADLISAQIMAQATQIDPGALADFYWRESAYLEPQGALRTDKLPGNTYYLGLIAKAFPKGKIVHVKRDPLDACFAIYKQLFAGAYPFSYAMDELAHYYVNYHRLMNHWRSVLGERLVEVQYEHLVANPKQEISQLLARLGLDFEEACLNFHQQKHTVATASAAQVREKPHARSVGRWRHFEELMRPVKEELARANII
ncbi:sulfotransferase [Simiduia sp. 21SJ11W-1]|uniref:tetratricopeptide repeat-containing sulfotransferase family protein n=1 Tax=Simiduia sp. 21SJ11W-1 TaxID=2909669 RepID=UPI00209F7FC3|nr:sulfotransferase [Simiduia sp. 21SJ11W-1]UTA47394.1 sulfotransferase [Simiduia sp. 21SJ11W-1]